MKPDWLVGCQEPRLSVVPEGDATRGERAVEFVRAVGMTLYPWQEDLLRDMCRVESDGLWSAREVLTVVPRQNGKGEVLVARELAGVYLFGEKLIMHSAHFLDTAIDASNRLWDIISDNEELMFWWAEESDDLPKLIKSNGKEAIHFPNGATIMFRTRTKKTGRGLSFDLLVFDECFDLPNEVYAAMDKTTRAKTNAQKIFISSPVNRFEHAHGAIMSAKRWAALDGAQGMLFKEWSPADDADPFDPATWRQSNPSLVLRGHPGAQLIELESEAASARKSADLRDSFLVESLGRGSWVPRDDDDSDFVPILDIERWVDCFTAKPKLTGDSCLGVDVTPDGETVSVVAALRTEKGVHLSLSPLNVFDRDEIVASVQRTVELNDPLAVVIDPKGPASTLQRPLDEVGVSPELIKWSQVTAATELFLTLFAEGKLTHDGDPRWVEALEVAQFRDGNANGRALTRKEGVVAQLVAATFAVWGLDNFGIPVAPDVKRKKKFVGRSRSVPRSSRGSLVEF